MAKEAEQAVDLSKVLKDTFGHDDFMTIDQKKGTEEVLQGEGDVYINLPPGAGKSICFQLPSVLKENCLTVVFVPTNCLGEVQVDLLKQKNLNAEYLCPATWRKLQNAIDQDLKVDKFKLRFLYASTDKRTRDFVIGIMAKLHKRKAITFLVFDEAQCISRFSNDYTPAYREVAELTKHLLPSIRKIVLTATVTFEGKNDIFKTLGMKKPQMIFPSTLLPKYQDVRFIDTLQDPLQDLKTFIDKHMGPSDKRQSNLQKYGIILCRKKQAAKKIEKELRALDIPVVSCHGDLSSKDRKTILGRWRSGEITVIVTTPQFVLGLHRPNVRFIVHWSLPMSIQQLYQGNGRTAQDGTRTWCRIYFSVEEENSIMTHIKSLPRGSREEADISSQKHRLFVKFVEYCFGTKCRLVAQMACIGQIVNRCDRYCDACCDATNLKKRIDAFLSIRSDKKQLLASQAEGTGMQNSRQNSGRHWVYTYFFRKPLEIVFAAPKARERSYNRLLAELTQNYNEAHAEIKKRINEDDIREIARQVEYSVFMDAKNDQKYNHDVVQTIRVIRKSKASKVACGYLRYYKPEKKSERCTEREIKEERGVTDIKSVEDNKRQSVAKMEVSDPDETN